MSTQASQTSKATETENSVAVKFNRAVALSDDNNRRNRAIEEFGSKSPVIAVRTVDQAIEVAKRTQQHRPHLSIVCGEVTTEGVEKLISDDAACAAIDGITIVQSSKSSGAIPVLVDALIRDETAYSTYLRKEAQLEEARRQRAEAGASEDAAEDEPLDALDEDLGAKPPKPTTFQLRNITIVEEAATFANAPDLPQNVGRFVEKSNSLESLRLVRDALNGPGASAVCAAVLLSRSVTRLDLSGNGFGRDEEPPVEKIAELLQNSKYLLDINLSDNDLGPAAVKLLSEALATSNTRIPTPEPEPEPEFEPHTDELGDLEEPPAKPGYPEDQAKATDDAGAEGEAAAGDEAAIAAAESTPPGDESSKPQEGEDEAEAEEAEEEKKAEEAEPLPEEAEPEDEEERERLAEERTERKREARAEAEAAWREREEQYMWGPQRAQFEYGETTARRAVLQQHLQETSEWKAKEHQGKLDARKDQRTREKRDRERRSGWSHLTALSLAGNQIASEGAIALATALRHEIPLAGGGDAGDADEERPLDAQTTREAAKPQFDDNEDEERDEERDEEEEKGDSAAPATEERQPEDGTDEAPTPAPVHKKKTTQAGLQTIRYLDLSRGAIGSKGMKALATVLADNCPSLETLKIARNKFAAKHVHEPVTDDAHPEGEEDDESPRKTRKVPVPAYVSPGVTALARCVLVNRSITHLDIGHNQLYPAAGMLLASSLKNNTALKVLRLDGNPLFHDNNCTALDTLFAVLPSMTELSELSLAGCGLGGWCNAAEDTSSLAAVFAASALNLSGNFLGEGRGISALSEAAGKYGKSPMKSLLLDRNNFDGATSPELKDGLCHLLGFISRRLETLSLSDNPNISDAVLVALADALKQAPSLKVVALRRTRGRDAIRAVAQFVAHSLFLTALDLGDCDCSEDAAVEVANAVSASASMRHVSIWSRDGTWSSAVLQAFVARPPKGLISVDVGLPSARGRDPEDDSDESYAIEDVDQILLRNAERSLQRESA
jgi:Ran GTPase-activating protein (RanGAP) involved in mRNA processing and transport